MNPWMLASTIGVRTSSRPPDVRFEVKCSAAPRYDAIRARANSSPPLLPTTARASAIIELEDLAEERVGIAGDARVFERGREHGAADLARVAGLVAEHEHGSAQRRERPRRQRRGARLLRHARLDADEVDDDGVLGRVVHEEGALGHAGALDDGVDGGVVVPARREQLGGGGEQARARVVGSKLAGGALGGHRWVTIGQ